MKKILKALLSKLNIKIRKLPQKGFEVRLFPSMPWGSQGSILKHSIYEFSSSIAPEATYSPWLTDEEFLNIYNKISKSTLVDKYRCYELWSLAKQTLNIEGDILEVGVWRGGTGAILAEAVNKSELKKVYLADTFRGVVKLAQKMRFTKMENMQIHLMST